MSPNYGQSVSHDLKFDGFARHQSPYKNEPKEAHNLSRGFEDEDAMWDETMKGQKKTTERESDRDTKKRAPKQETRRKIRLSD